MKPVPEIVSCKPVGPTSLRLRFRDGLTGTLDLQPILRGPLFGALKRPDKFREVAVHNSTLVWSNGADICPTVLRHWCELGRVCSQKELDAHFSPATSAEVATTVAESQAKYGKQR